ncbi:MAG: hypothetical protein EXR72_15465 [Myxococcales bacterium]|nr:hypothetical protein [Myxococcales bacterium]
MNDDQFFPFEKLHVYQVAKEVLVMAVRNRARFRGLPGELPSQLRRDRPPLRTSERRAGRIQSPVHPPERST